LTKDLNDPKEHTNYWWSWVLLPVAMAEQVAEDESPNNNIM